MLTILNLTSIFSWDFKNVNKYHKHCERFFESDWWLHWWGLWYRRDLAFGLRWHFDWCNESQSFQRQNSRNITIEPSVNIMCISMGSTVRHECGKIDLGLAFYRILIEKAAERRMGGGAGSRLDSWVGSWELDEMVGWLVGYLLNSRRLGPSLRRQDTKCNIWIQG